MNHEKHAIAVTTKAVKVYGEGLAVAFNGGKDSVVTVDLLERVCRNQRITLADFLFIKLGGDEEFPEMDMFISEYTSSLGVEVHSIPGSDIKESMKNLKELYPHIQALILGTRSTDPGAGSLTEFADTSAGWPQFVRVSPILSWRYKDVWNYIQKRKVPYCSLYERGYTSIGGMCSTKPNPRLKRDSWYLPAWELSDEASERDGRAESAD